MRRTLVILHLLIALFFTASLGYTLIAKEHLPNLARAFAIEKAIEHGDPIVDVAEATLKFPALKRLLSIEQVATVEKEINDYRTDRRAYITRLTRVAKTSTGVIEKNPLLAKVSSIKHRIAIFYHDTLDALIEDFRIFAASNLMAALFALVCAWRSRNHVNKSLVILSAFMLIALVYGVLLYINSLSFFRILFRIHMGWWYLAILMLIVGLMWGENVRSQHRQNDVE